MLPGLAKAWAAKLKKYYPKVNISVDPPYAGSLGAVELIKGNLDCVFVWRAEADRHLAVPRLLRV